MIKLNMNTKGKIEIFNVDLNHSDVFIFINGNKFLVKKKIKDLILFSKCILWYESKSIRYELTLRIFTFPLVN